MLAKPEMDRLLLLIGLQRLGRFTPAHEAELRRLVATESPQRARELPLDLLIEFGLGMAAVPYFLRMLGEPVDAAA